MSQFQSKCPICGHSEIKELTYLNKTGYRLMKCLACSFIFIFPRPHFNELIEYYTTEFKFNYEPEPLSRTKAAKKAYKLSRLIKTYNPDTKRVLDIGCSYGHLLYGLKELGYEVMGTDLSKQSCEYAIKYYGLKVYNSEFPPKRGYFDFIVLSALIEHLIEPKEFLKKCYTYLGDEGGVYILTPNIDSLLFNIFGKHFEMIKPPEHISFFNPKSIKRLFTEAGFKCVYVYTENPIWVDWNFFNYTVSSCLRLFGVTQMIRRKYFHSERNILASSTGITRKNYLLKNLRLVMDYSTRVISLSFYPFMKLLEKFDKGLFLYAIGKKI